MSSRRKFSLDEIELTNEDLIPQKPLISRPPSVAEPTAASTPLASAQVPPPAPAPEPAAAIPEPLPPAFIDPEPFVALPAESFSAPPVPAAATVTVQAPQEPREEPPVATKKETTVAIASKAPASPVATGHLDRIQLLAEQRFKPIADKRQTSVRLEPWLDDALNERFFKMKLQGYRRITREAIIVDALMQYLGVTPPE